MKIQGKTSSEIVESIRTLQISGELLPNQQLPPLRELAQHLNVNRNTVAYAYKRLVLLGIASTHRRNGTVLNDLTHAGEQEGFSSDLGINLGSGNPNPDFLPNPIQFLEKNNFKPHLYGEESILPSFKDWILNDFQKDCPTSKEITLTYGSVDAIERIINSHLISGDLIAVEDPCYLGSINAIRLAGIVPIGVEIDEFGLIPSSLSSAMLKGIKAILITPRAQNPTGCSLSHQRALEIKRILSKYPKTLVIIDDHYALLSSTKYYSIIPNNIQNWSLIRSVSKALGPDMRLAYVAADQNTIAKINARMAPGTTWVSHLIQEIVYKCLISNEFKEKLKNIKEQYNNQREYLCELLSLHEIDYFTSYDGFNVWINLPEFISEQVVIDRLQNEGWLVRAGKTFEIERKANAIRVTITELDKIITEKFVKALEKCFQEI